MAKSSRIRHIRKCLLSRKVIMTNHAKERMVQRGYNSVDIIRAVLNGLIVEVQRGFDPEEKKNALVFVIEGKDYFDNPVIIVACERIDGYCIVTVMPPTDKKRFSECI